MSLPNELLLDIIGFLDYNSIVPAKFVDSTFLRLITEYSESLARQRHFTLLIQNAWVTYTDDADTARRNIRCDPEIHESFAEPCHRLASVTGHHIVDQVQFMDNTWNRPYILGIFAIAAVKYAPKLGLIRSSNPAFAPHAVSSAFLCQFVRLRSLYLALDPEVEAFPWNLLRSDTFRGLTCLKISPQRQNWSDTVFDEVVHYCSTLPDPSDGERLLDVSASRFPEAFIERLVNVRLSSFVLRLTVTSATLFPRTFVKQLISSLTTSDQRMTISLRTPSPFALVADERQRMGMTYENVLSKGGTYFIGRYSSGSGGVIVDVTDPTADCSYVDIRSTSTQTHGFQPTS